MANRVVHDDVADRIVLNTVTDTTPFIDTANRITDTLVGKTDKITGVAVEESVLTDIELYLALHFTSLHTDEKEVTKQKLGDASEDYAGKYDRGLNSTSYGQTAVLLDTTGVLGTMNSEKTVSISHIDVDYD